MVPGFLNIKIGVVIDVAAVAFVLVDMFSDSNNPLLKNMYIRPSQMYNE